MPGLLPAAGDSSPRVNNFLWAFNAGTKRLTRLLSCPSGAESNGLHAKVADALDPLVRANYRGCSGAAVGYLTGLPKPG